MKKRQIIALLGLVFLLGSFLRLWRLDEIPPGFTPDEAAQGYTAYSLSKTGRDEWGIKWPLNLRSFGDFKPPLQTYLMIPTVAALGLNETAVRLPNAFLASLTLVGVFLLADELFSSPMAGLISAALLAISPWHLPLSRGAFEANLTVFFFSFGFYFFLKMLKAPRWCWQILAALFLGLNLFSYHSAKLITPLIVLIFLGYKFWPLRVKRQKWAALIREVFVKQKLFWLLFGSAFLLAYVSFFNGGQTRGADIAIFHPTDNWQAVKDERWWAVRSGLPALVARFFHNKLTYSLTHFSKNYLAYFSPQFFFSEGPGEGTYGMIPGRGVLCWWSLPLLLLGVYWLIKNPQPEMVLLVVIILLTPLPAALAKGNRAANRAAVMMPWINIFLAAVIWRLLNMGRKISQQKKFALIIISFLIVFYFAASFSEDYFIQSPRKIAPAMLYGRCRALRWVAKHYPQAKTVVVSRRLSEPQAYVMFCLRYPPKEVQKASPSWQEYSRRHLSFLDQLGDYHLGKFIFREINWASDRQLKNAVLVGKPEEFPGEAKVDKIIYYPNHQPAIKIYKTIDYEK